MKVLRNWMAILATHYEQTRRCYPHDKLLILFDIDGTILDMRHMLHKLLQTYDRDHGATFFQQLDVTDINVHENQIQPLLEALEIEPAAQQAILTWFEQHAWSSQAVLEAHRPFAGVLEVIRWFQMQPNTYVGLNTGRPESFRADTLRSLNQLGQEYKVNFTNELFYLRPDDWGQDMPGAKVAGIRHFQASGYRVFAFIDNEPDNLQAISASDPQQEILLLHADTIFQSKRTQLPQRVIGGQEYDLTALITEEALPRHTQFVWEDLNDPANLAQFLASDVHWGEVDVRLDPTGGDLILRRDAFEQCLLQPQESWLTLAYALDQLRYRQKGLKLDLKGGGPLIDRVLKLVVTYGFNSPNLWFTGDIETVQEEGFRHLATAYPGSVIECPIDFLALLIYERPGQAKEILDRLESWGLNRFALNWQTPHLRAVFDQVGTWGFDLNVYNVPDLNAFLQAVLLGSRSITSTFNFPQWHYYGTQPVNREVAIRLVG